MSNCQKPEKQQQLFAVGPVNMLDSTLAVARNGLPYSRTREFSNIITDVSNKLVELCHAGDDARALLLTGSGTLGMEAALLNCFNEQDKLLIVNSGSFGQRFVDIATTLSLNFTEIVIEFGRSIEASDLKPYENQGFGSMRLRHPCQGCASRARNPKGPETTPF